MNTQDLYKEFLNLQSNFKDSLSYTSISRELVNDTLKFLLAKASRTTAPLKNVYKFIDKKDLRAGMRRAYSFGDYIAGTDGQSAVKYTLDEKMEEGYVDILGNSINATDGDAAGFIGDKGEFVRTPKYPETDHIFGKYYYTNNKIFKDVDILELVNNHKHHFTTNNYIAVTLCEKKIQLKLLKRVAGLLKKGELVDVVVDDDGFFHIKVGAYHCVLCPLRD